MTYGRKLQPGDRWKVGRRWVEWDGEKVVGSCGLEFGPNEFRTFANCAAWVCVDCETPEPHVAQQCPVYRKSDGASYGARKEDEAECIAQQIVAEGLVP